MCDVGEVATRRSALQTRELFYGHVHFLIGEVFECLHRVRIEITPNTGAKSLQPDLQIERILAGKMQYEGARPMPLTARSRGLALYARVTASDEGRCRTLSQRIMRGQG